MEPEVDTNMKKCITYVLSPKRASDPAYGKDWLMIDWLIYIFFLQKSLFTAACHDMPQQDQCPSSSPRTTYSKGRCEQYIM